MKTLPVAAERSLRYKSKHDKKLVQLHLHGFKYLECLL
jgi:hypothetical protein